MTKLKSFKATLPFPKAILTIFILQIIVLLAIYFQVKQDESILYIIGVLALVILFILMAKIKLFINEEHIKYGLFPLPINTVKWQDIDNVEVIKISAYSDFLGIGLRSSKKYGKGYITDSSNAFFIQKTNGDKITISIEKPEELFIFLTSLNKI